MIKGAKSIAEYAIRKHLEQEGFVMECFTLEMTRLHETELKDGSGDCLKLIYNPQTRTVIAV